MSDARDRSRHSDNLCKQPERSLLTDWQDAPSCCLFSTHNSNSTLTQVSLNSLLSTSITQYSHLSFPLSPCPATRKESTNTKRMSEYASTTSTNNHNNPHLEDDDEEVDVACGGKRPLKLSSQEKWLLLEQQRQKKKQRKAVAKTLKEIREGRQLDLGIWLGFKKPKKAKAPAKFRKRTNHCWN